MARDVKAKYCGVKCKRLLPSRKYRAHRQRAKIYGIEFLLTLEEWTKIWMDSGHWKDRGIKKGKYQMARFGDKGPYAVGNVEIITGEENRGQIQVRQKLSRSLTGGHASAETKKKLSSIRQGSNNSNSKLSETEVLAIRKIGHSVPYTKTAEYYGVTPEMISNIIHRKNWKELQ